MTIIADAARACIQYRIKYALMMILWYKYHQFIEIVRMNIIDRCAILNAKHISHPIIHASIGNIQIGVGYIHCDIILNQLLIHFSHRSVALQICKRAINNRMMGNNQVDTLRDRLINNLLVNIKSN
ncbi:hypothetical protein D3C81_1901670 [compost metagenome]